MASRSRISAPPTFEEEPSPLQAVVNTLFGEPPAAEEEDLSSKKDLAIALTVGPTVSRFEAVMAAETACLSSELQDVVEALPPGEYTRVKLCINLNSIIASRGLSRTCGLVS